MSDITDQVIHKNHWQGHSVEIRDADNFRSLYFGSHYLQSRMAFSHPHKLILSYTCFMVMGLLIVNKPQSILAIGIGSGSLVRFFHHHFPQCHIDAVDYSQHIINIARGYFQLPKNAMVEVHCADGLQFLQNNREKRYDFILVDAFDGQGMSPTIYSQTFFELCKNCLSADGIISTNLWSGDNNTLQQIKDILTENFSGSIFLPIPGYGNIVSLTMPFAPPWDKICQKDSRLQQLSQQYNIDFGLMVKIAKQKNLSFAEKMKWLLQ